MSAAGRGQCPGQEGGQRVNSDGVLTATGPWSALPTLRHCTAHLLTLSPLLFCPFLHKAFWDSLVASIWVVPVI